MALTYKEAQDITISLTEKFMIYSKTDITSVSIGASDKNKAKKTLKKAQDNNDMDIYYLSPVFNVVVASKGNFDKEQKNTIKQECKKIIGRNVDDTDIAFMSNFRVTLH